MISSPLSAPRLVGRDDECAFLMRRLDAALQQRVASVTIVEGAPGMGKTRLVAEVRRRARELRALVVDAYALEHVREPYAPFVLGIERALEGAPAGVAAELRAVAAALEPAAGLQKASRLRAVASALRRVLRDTAVTMVVEDLHWADRASLDLLAFFTLELAETPLFLVATQRPQAQSALADALRTGAHTVRLGALADRDVATLLREALRGQGAIGADRLRRITQLAAGNPLFALELLRNALAGAEDDVAPAVVYPIVRRWETLDASTREILAAAAAAGEIEPQFVAEVAGHAVDAVERALERGERQHLVARDRANGRWTFPHALTREAIERRVPPRRRVELHRRIGELLEARHAAVEPARLAYHWTIAGEGERAMRYDEAAGDRAVALHDYATAQRCFSAALRHAPAELDVQARLNEKLSSAALIEASPSSAAQPIDAALAAYAALDDAAGCARMEMHRSRFAWFQGDPAGSLAAAERARALVDAGDQRALRFDVHVRLAQIHQLAGRAAEARHELELADALREAATPDAVIRFLNARAMLRADAWEIDAFLRDYEEAVAIAERLGHTELLVSTQNNRALNAFLTGRRDVAIPVLESSIATSYEFGLRWHVPNALLSLARVRHVFGDVAGARTAFEDALTSTYEAARVDTWVACYGLLLALDSGDDALLERCARADVLDAALARGEVTAIAHLAAGHAALAALRGDAARACEVVSRALEALRDDARPLFLCAAVARYGRDADLARARALLDAPARDRSRSAERALFDAYVALRRRRRNEAAQHALTAAERYGELGWVLCRAAALEAAGRAAQALEIYEAAGAQRPAVRLRGAGRAPDLFAPLTKREREIAALVLEGFSNREVGRRLTLSERTVGNHVQSIFNRLGIGSRRELAAYAGEVRPE